MTVEVPVFRHLLGVALVVVLVVAPLSAVAESPDDRYWTAVSPFGGEIGLVDGIASGQGNLYVGGHFLNANSEPITNLACWDGISWTPVGGGVGTDIMTSLVHVIVKDGDDFWVGGMFDQVGGLWPASNIAHWDGVNWNTMGGGTDRAIRTIVKAANGDIYAGGEFTMAGGVTARGVARWDGSNWHALGEGINNHVMVVVTKGEDVYVGGAFSSAGGQRIGFLARFDGSEWHPLGSGVNGFVNAMAFSGNELYVGGGFRLAGGKVVNRIARWNGASWFPLGDGVSGPGEPRVRAIYVDGPDVYVGGFFTSAGGSEVGYVARWDGQEWSPLGSGVDYTVKNMTKHGDDLYVTGEFDSAGGQSSPYLAKWNRPVVIIESFDAQVAGNAVTLAWQSTVNGQFQGYRVYRRDGSREEVIISGDELIGETAASFTDETASPGRTYEYAVAAVRDDGAELRSGWVSVMTNVISLVVAQNHPNPFNPGTQIDYILPSTSHVSLNIFDVRGKLVRVLVNETRGVGQNTAEWDGLSSNGEPMATGVYFYRLEAEGASETKKMMLLR